jgi:hypothetical protein
MQHAPPRRVATVSASPPVEGSPPRPTDATRPCRCRGICAGA